MNIKTKRQIASKVLLAVLLPMLLLSSLHIHSVELSAAGEECTNCVQHQCGGHIAQQAHTLHDCVLCQFLSLPMVIADQDGIQIDGICNISYAQCQQTLLVQTLGIIVTRGPPAVLET